MSHARVNCNCKIDGILFGVFLQVTLEIKSNSVQVGKLLRLCAMKIAVSMSTTFSD